ncbi:MAG TPA: outer membrane beta-barrel protein [Gemmatimonadaceae bacterium]|nr:outer membrane beta-barrel protein [Gemmatimonadaceae bacterium]
MKIAGALTALLVAIVPATSSAQWISIGLRGSGSVPTGSFAEDETTSSDAVVTGAKNGFGYGVEAAAGIGGFGLYAGFDHVKFDCETTNCFDEGKYILQGVSAGLKMSGHKFRLFRPFIRGGVTFNKLSGDYGPSSSGKLTSDRAPGYEVGVGADVSLAGLIGLVPQFRYVGQNLKVKVPGVDSPDPDGTGVNYFTFDVGLVFHTPYSLFGK